MLALKVGERKRHLMLMQVTKKSLLFQATEIGGRGTVGNIVTKRLKTLNERLLS